MRRASAVAQERPGQSGQPNSQQASGQCASLGHRITPTAPACDREQALRPTASWPDASFGRRVRRAVVLLGAWRGCSRQVSSRAMAAILIASGQPLREHPLHVRPAHRIWFQPLQRRPQRVRPVRMRTGIHQPIAVQRPPTQVPALLAGLRRRTPARTRRPPPRRTDAPARTAQLATQQPEDGMTTATAANSPRRRTRPAPLHDQQPDDRKPRAATHVMKPGPGTRPSTCARRRRTSHPPSDAL